VNPADLDLIGHPELVSRVAHGRQLGPTGRLHECHRVGRTAQNARWDSLENGNGNDFAGRLDLHSEYASAASIAVFAAELEPATGGAAVGV
jgi:hypothetical protein